MKVFVASALLLVGSCANLRYNEKIESLKESISFDDKAVIDTYLKTINAEDLKQHLEEVSSDKYQGRLTGEKGHNEVCNYIRNYYKALNIAAPASNPNYFQKVPKSTLPDGLNDSQNVIAYH